MDAKTELLERVYWAVVDYLNTPPELDSHGAVEDELEDAMESARAELAVCGVMVETIKRPRNGDVVRQIGGQQTMIVTNPALGTFYEGILNGVLCEWTDTEGEHQEVFAHTSLEVVKSAIKNFNELDLE